ncbi:hypothetical protein GNF10_33535 [Nostoc sp. UCD121]|uniref:hypothetical protein n=1 Tax=Nostoc sp. UCD121 TaxID=2681305 RepID=UPI0016287349|nr:hypothetical protein [Nostoc sp. UCD121]MBC1280731.1 hypothetical protein [Nostoc sp. UCD121]
MNINHSKNLLKIVASLVGVASTAVLMSLPVYALSQSSSRNLETSQARIGDRLYSQAGESTGGSNTETQQYPNNGTTGTQQYPNNGTTGTQQYPNNGTTGTQQYPNNGTTGTQQNTDGNNTTGGQNTGGGVRALW